ncbi:transmembrane protein [Ralstonia solanacearum]|nr:putative transmembrane protein [Ralstonia pseudosolanacearum FQY_4]ANH33998.1 transmembrane protein [Ralstonia solanacearum]
MRAAGSVCLWRGRNGRARARILGAVGNAVAGTIAAIGRPPFVML